MGRYTKLRRNLLNLFEISGPLDLDVNYAMRRRQMVDRFHRGRQEDNFEFAFWNRASVRCLFCLMEGMSNFMRHTASRPGNAKVLGLSVKQRAKLLERKYDAKTDRITEILIPNRVGENIKLAFRYYPQLFGVEFSLDTNSKTWKVLIKELVPARNRMTHAGNMEDFYVLEAAQTLGRCYIWFLGNFARMLRDCCEQIELPVPEFEFDRLKEYEIDPEDLIRLPVSREAFSQEVGKIQGRVVTLLQWTTELLRKELMKALEMAIRRKTSGPGDGHAQFAIRNGYRTIISYIEGNTDMYRFYLEHAHARGEIRLSDEDQVRLQYKDPLDRLTATYELFSREVGTGNKIQASDAGWEAVRRVLTYRNRLTHPQKARDLQFEEASTLETLSEVLRWLLAVLEVILIDTEKMIAQGIRSGSIISSEA